MSRQKRDERKNRILNADILPPVLTKTQDLPFDQLTWENFEKLCLRLVKQESNIEDTRQYGNRGDKQDGIDIYAKLKNEEGYVTYQCKREKEFGPEKIKAALDTFLAGNWVARSKKFVLCTQESLSSKRRADSIEEQRSRLQRLGHKIEFEPWDADALSSKLKGFPDIVEDFFSLEWAERFCYGGSDSISNSRQSLERFQKYKDWLTKTTSYFEIPMVDEDFSVSEDWIARNLTSRKNNIGSIDAEVAAEVYPRILLKGSSGSGKSTLMRRLANSFASIGKVVLYLNLADVLGLYKDGTTFEKAITLTAIDGSGIDLDDIVPYIGSPDYLIADGAGLSLNQILSKNA